MLITSLNNSNVVEWTKLKQVKHQKQQKQFIIEEKLLIKQAIKANLKCRLVARDGLGINADYYVTDAIMKKISNNTSLNDVIAVCDFYDVEINNPKKIVYLDNVQDPGNVGTIIRTAYAFGFDQIVLANQTASKYNHKLVSATKGAIFHMSVVDSLSLDDYKEMGYSIIVTAIDKDAKKLQEFKKEDKLIMVFGNEGSGVSSDILRNNYSKLYIEMDNFDSLNVAISAGIILYHFK